ncbi:hypothetical protein Lal_00000655 [Lupinus albus]|nr:hypothetical protein Lal_00000655 [Lupinus albus]
MAPSSRSKRARNTKPLDFSCLLKDDEQQKRFLNHYIERQIMTPKYGSLAAFEEQGCHFPSLIRAQVDYTILICRRATSMSLFVVFGGMIQEMKAPMIDY